MELEHDPNKIPFALTDTDRENLAGGDENFQPHNWEDLKHIIASNNLSVLKRKPSNLLRYIKWTNRTIAEFGSITKFVYSNRLLWVPLHDSPETGLLFACLGHDAFAFSMDYKIKLNDWPYGLTPDITHLVVWSKQRLREHKPAGDLTPESIMVVKFFIQHKIIDMLAAAGVSDAAERVLWFRNWTGLQSVRGLEHVHILVRNAPQEVLDDWTRDPLAAYQTIPGA